MVAARRRKKKPHSNVGGDPAAPRPAEWARMEQYGSFTITDDEGRDTIFKLGDTATVVPAGTKFGVDIPAHKYWVVRIAAIRGRNPFEGHPKSRKAPSQAKAQLRIPEYWVKINWYYSPTEVAYKIKGFAASHCSKYERIYSDHSELVSPSTFNALVPVIKFREDNPEQEPIFDEEFFVRYFLTTSVNPGGLSNYALETSTHLQDSVGCICGCPYDLKAKTSLHIMHMCPRPHCRRFYHSCCLRDHGHWAVMTDRFIRLLSSPDTDDDPFPSRSVSGHSTRKADPTSCSSMKIALDKIIPQLPENLLRLAGQPIVRGAAISGLGITGNCRSVVFARRVVYAAIREEISDFDGWEEGIDSHEIVADSDLPALRHEDTGQVVVFTCPKCSGPI
ncbi:hypothetical protein B0H11DRAFT_2090442 [Mycena galericulata]|nr:hypothetical protein B0H11DRAFT_2090442 [Mycena galericulata]